MSLPPWFAVPPATRVKHRRALVIGAGIAGAHVANALAKRGWRVSVYERHPQVAQAGSGNFSGLIRPQVKHTDSPLFQLYRAGFEYLLNAFPTLKQAPFAQLNGAFCAAQYQASLEGQSGFEHLTAAQASRRLNLPLTQAGYWLENAGWIEPKAWIRQLLDHPNITCHTAHSVTDMAQLKLQTSTNVLVLCNAQDTERLAGSESLTLHTSSSQVFCINAPYPEAQHALCGSDYAIPRGNHWVVGAHHRLHEPAPHLSTNNGCETLKLWRLLKPPQTPPRQRATRVAVRVNTQDNLPIAGALPDWHSYQSDYADLHHGRPSHRYPQASYQPRCFVLTGLGGHGLTSSALLSAHIVASVEGRPSPLPSSLQAAVHPARFLIRQLKRRPTVKSITN